MPIIERKDLLTKMIKDLKNIDQVVKVGVQGPEAAQNHPQEPGHAGKTPTMLELAAIHEFGAPSANIPQRSFIRALADSEREVWSKELEVQLTKIVNKLEDGKAKGDAKGALFVLGEKYRTAIIKRMEAGIPPPNADITIERKGSDTPLIDDGHLLRSITSVVGPPVKSGAA